MNTNESRQRETDTEFFEIVVAIAAANIYT